VGGTSGGGDCDGSRGADREFAFGLFGTGGGFVALVRGFETDVGVPGRILVRSRSVGALAAAGVRDDLLDGAFAPEAAVFPGDAVSGLGDFDGEESDL
jgi:hypothetical protein